MTGPPTDPHAITTLDRLLEVYPTTPVANSVRKESPVLTPAYADVVRASPFLVIATLATDGTGIDQSPRGDAPGFVEVLDERTLVIPDRRGNNRLDTLRNLVADPRIGLLFLVPGIGEELRVRGTAALSTDPAGPRAADLPRRPTSMRHRRGHRARLLPVRPRDQAKSVVGQGRPAFARRGADGRADDPGGGRLRVRRRGGRLRPGPRGTPGGDALLSRAAARDPLVVVDHLGDDEAQELLGERRVEARPRRRASRSRAIWRSSRAGSAGGSPRGP